MLYYCKIAWRGGNFTFLQKVNLSEEEAGLENKKFVPDRVLLIVECFEIREVEIELINVDERVECHHETAIAIFSLNRTIFEWSPR